MAEEITGSSVLPEGDPTTPAVISTQLLAIEQLFNTSWFPSVAEQSSPCHHSKQTKPTSQSSTIEFLKKYLPVVIYIPFGSILCILRLCVLLQFLLLLVVLPRSTLKQRAIRVMCLVLGITYSIEGEVRTNETRKEIFISNYITNLDHFIIHLVTDSISPLKKATMIPSWILKRIGFTNNRFSTKEEISGEQQSIVLFPEVESTNGKLGLLAFERFSMLEDITVRPIGVKVSRSLLNVNTVQNGLSSELFLFMFLPNTHYVLRFLPSQTWNAQIIQECVGTSLKVLPTRYNASDKLEYVKKLNFRPPSITTMTRLVQQQLHPVIMSPETIIATLQRTGGSVGKTVEELRKSMAEPSFHKSATERMMNFQERKRMMIESAKKNYCEKHGLEF